MQELLELKTKILSLGSWLENKHYKGIDVSIKNPPKEISSTIAFSCIGWINFYLKYGEKDYLIKAENCLLKLLRMKSDEDLWLFPYKFRDNPPNFPYSCENFMTLNALFYYMDKIRKREDIVENIERTLNSMLNRIEYTQNGCFYYSPRDKIKVPNISSMAANIFAKAYLIYNDNSYLEKAHLFANYCIKNQRDDGGYNYFSNQKMVYIPYHALEIWELLEANRIIKSSELKKSINKAIDFIREYYNKNHYFSCDTHSRSVIKKFTILFKTPLWMAKAFLMAGDYHFALKHYKKSIKLFRVSNNSPYYFYLLKIFKLGPFKFSRPQISSIFIRYNASCFEIGSRFLIERNKI